MNLNDVLGFVGLSDYKNDPTKDKQVPMALSAEAEPKRVLYSWNALARPKFQSLNQKKVRTLMLIGVFLGVFLLLIQEFTLVLGALSLLFVLYALNTVPPEEVTYEISNHGIKYDKIMYSWKNVRWFYFSNKPGEEVAVLDMVDAFPKRLYLSLANADVAQVKAAMENYAHFIEEEPTSMADKAYESVSKNIDLQS